MKSVKPFFLLLILGWCGSVHAQPREYSRFYNSNRDQHPVISDIVSAINQDSLAAFMQMMVDMGTRFMYAENRREVASTIAEKFMSFGCNPVELDSFRMEGETVPEDSVWQYNVVATLTGTSAPGEIYIISAHHDDYVNPDPHMPAPGADDNASSCAVELEIARVLQEKGFQPASTIRFVTYAAEELVGYKKYSGSIYYANQMFARGEDLRLDICNDMVAYTPDSSYSVWGVDLQDKTSAWAGDLMQASASLYASLNIHSGSSPSPDAYQFHDLGFPVTGFEEYGLTPNYHTVNDSVSNCIMPFCLEVARANCAILLNEQLTPIPKSPYCLSDTASVTVCWKPTENASVQGYKIFRSTNPDSAFSFLGYAVHGDSSFTDTTADAGILYYYSVVSFDTLSYESIRTNLVRGAIFPKDRDLLVVKDTRGGFNNPPDSIVNAFYQQIFKDLIYDYSDASVSDSLNLSTLGRYQRILWLSNSHSDEPNSSFRRNAEDITTYLRNEGQLLVAGFSPTFMIAGNKTANKTFSPADTLCLWFKIREVQRRPNAALNGAWPCQQDYDSLRIDPDKAMTELPGHVVNVECIFPAPEASVIYRFNSAYDTTTVFGKMKGKPVGIEYLGDDFKVILLSVPLYYLDSLDAKSLVEVVVNKKFKPQVGLEEIPGVIDGSLVVHVYPNPVQDQATLLFTIPERSPVWLSVFGVRGEEMITLSKGLMGPGFQTISLDLTRFPAGIYIGRLSAGNRFGAVRMIKE